MQTMEEKDIMQEITVSGKYLEYKGRPLVREDNMICYGYMDDPYVLQMTIMTTKQKAPHSTFWTSNG